MTITRTLTRLGGGVALTALIATAAAVPVGAAVVEDCDGLAHSGEDFVAELACTPGEGATEVSITLANDIVIPADAVGLYEHELPLVIDGAGYTASTAPGDDVDVSSAQFLTVSPSEFGGSGLTTVPVTVRDIVVEGFARSGAIAVYSTGLLTIEDSVFADNSSATFFLETGGAVATYGSIEIIDSAFVGNSAFLGGAVSARGGLISEDLPGDVTISGSSFIDNSAPLLGGAVFATGDTLVTDSEFIDNAAGSGGAVAGLGALRADMQFDDVYFAGNVATEIDGDAFGDLRAGGAIITDFNVSLSDVVFEDNVADHFGGAIAMFPPLFESYVPGRGSLSVSDATFAGNDADFGSVVAALGDLTLDSSTVTGNTGRAAVVAVGNSQLTNSTFVDNDLDTAVVMLNASAQTSVRHTTFADDLASEEAHLVLIPQEDPVEDSDLEPLAADVQDLVEEVQDEGFDVAVSAADTGDVEIIASAFAHGSSDTACAFEGDLAITSAYNADATGTCVDGDGNGVTVESADLALGALAANGGLTQTLLPAASSPLIDAVPAGDCTLGTDQRGEARPAGAGCDIGAVEVQPSEGGQTPGTVEFSVDTDSGTVFGSVTAAYAVEGVEWTPTAQISATPPAGVALPYGLIGFDVLVDTGATVSVTLTLPRPVNQAWKVQDDTWSGIAGVEFSAGGTVVTYSLTDGGAGDEDGEANGVIVDPIALAIQGTFTG